MFIEIKAQDRTLRWQVLDNAAANIWYKNFKKIYRVPLQTVKPQNSDPQKNIVVDLNSFLTKHRTIIPNSYADLTQQTSFTVEDLNRCHEIYEYFFTNYFDIVDKNELYQYHMDLHELQGKIESSSLHNPDKQYFRTFGWYTYEGLLTKPITTEELACRTTEIQKGWIYLIWSEFGKLPFHYYSDNEPLTRDRFMQAVKPWITSKPAFSIALNTGDEFVSKDKYQDYQDWLSKVEWFDEWKNHFGIGHWDQLQEFGAIPIARPCFADCDEIDVFTQNLDLTKLQLNIVSPTI